jgi:hypothetical protein
MGIRVPVTFPLITTGHSFRLGLLAEAVGGVEFFQEGSIVFFLFT